MSNDLRSLSTEFRQILQNKAVIAVDQDKLGIMGKMVKSVGFKNRKRLSFSNKKANPYKCSTKYLKMILVRQHLRFCQANDSIL